MIKKENLITLGHVALDRIMIKIDSLQLRAIFLS